MKIKKLTYQGGMIKWLSEVSSLRKIEFAWNEIPDNILKVLEETKIHEIGGTYGDERVGSPIQYDSLLIEYEDKLVSIIAFNIAIFMFKAEDPYIKRVFQVMAQFQILQRNLRKEK